MADFINKVVLATGEVAIDLSSDTVSENDVASGVTFHDHTGATKTGKSTKDADTSGATANAGDILSGKTAGVRGAIIEGTMPNVGKQTSTITTKAQKVTISAGAHDGSGSVQIASTEQAKIIAENIREGITILGVAGAMSGSEDETPETGKVVTPAFESQSILPSSGFTCFKEITVSPIPTTRTPNAAGGITLTIG